MMIDVPRRLFASTYSDQDLLTTLYLENLRLRERLGFEPLSFADPVSPATAAEDSKYERTRDYLESRNSVPGRVRHLVLANEYPDYGAEYANGFVHRRVKAYQATGAQVDVIAYGKRLRPGVRVYDGVRILSGYVYELDALLALQRYDSISIHFLNAEMWKVLAPHLVYTHTPVHVFIHGYEADRWIRRAFDIDTQRRLKQVIDRTHYLQGFWQQVINSPTAPRSYIFVSDYWRRVVEDDMDVFFPRSRIQIVHNVIDTELFSYAKKNDDQRFRILWVRSAANRKYGADIAVSVLRRLLDSDVGSLVEATIIGDGSHFHLFEDAFVGEKRVAVQRRFASQTEIAELHRSHGLFLVPTRLDSQGVSRDEAMASGLVPITNAVTAIPEFVDDECAILSGDEDVDGLVEGTLAVMRDPAKFQRMSLAAAQRVSKQCGPVATVDREISILGLRTEASL